jgi:pimeloyl-ACP methyl ester carboxylesterase
MRRIWQRWALAVALLVAGAVGQPSRADDSGRLLRLDHYVGVRSTVPAISGQMTEIYVREVVSARSLRDGVAANRVVLFIHGAGTPAEVSFDVPYRDYSWMEYLARAGFDVFGMDNTGYGRSTRPSPMNDPCNLAGDQQLALNLDGHAETCAPSYGAQMTTIRSDWDEIGAVVDHLLALRHVPRVSLAAWSLGGPRAGGYTAQHPDKVQNLVLLAPAYTRDAADNPPAQVPAPGAAMTKQSRDDLTALWNTQVGCADQYDQAVLNAVWSSMLESDPVGATWGAGVRRAPQVTSWGWNAKAVAATRVPTMMVTGEHDKQVLSPRVRDLYADIGAGQKTLIELACSSHNAMWEKNHLLLFQASLEWLTKGTVNGLQQGTIRMGF